MSSTKHVQTYTDGACSGNPGPGGAAAVLHWERGKSTRVIGEAHTTNNRMEILACIVGLEVLHSRCRVTIYTDSQYVIGVMTKGWKRKANHALLAELDELCELHQVEFVHVKGHAGDPGNEEADRLAKAEAERQKSALWANGTPTCPGGSPEECAVCKEAVCPVEQGHLAKLRLGIAMPCESWCISHDCSVCRACPSEQS